LRRDPYIDTISIDDARAAWVDALGGGGPVPRTPAEEVPVREAVGRVTAAPVAARVSSPHYLAAAMDGIAVKAESTFGASETTPARLELGRDAELVNTGDPLPRRFDAVVMRERIRRLDDGGVEVFAAAVPWQHVRQVGEDTVRGELVLPEAHTIRPADLGPLLASGALRVPVRKRPRATILPTGDELVPPSEDPPPGRIIETNSAVLAAMVAEAGGEPLVAEPVPDDPRRIEARIADAAERSDIVLVIAGSSAGSKDFVPRAVRALGDIVVHGVAIRPGRPVLLGCIGGRTSRTGRAVAGLPGYPVSAVLAFDLFVRPLIEAMLGLPPRERALVRARLGRRIVSAPGAEEFVRVALGFLDEAFVAYPLASGAGVSSSLVRADGIARIPREREGVDQGEEVEVELLRPAGQIRSRALVVGSHDPSLDLLASIVASRGDGSGMSSVHVGSLGGIRAVTARTAHAAGTHLFDPESGDYNVSYARRFLGGREAVLFTLFHREQGLMVAKGNPRGLGGVEDLARPDVRIVNRQRGAGTRMLLDHLLQQSRVSPDDVRGYDREVLTHAAVAASINAGTADAGLGVRAAAAAMGLDFVPLAWERYELLVPEEYRRLRAVEAVLEAAASKRFEEGAGALGGYDFSEAGGERKV